MPRITNPEYVKRWTEQAFHGMTIGEIRRDHKNRTGKSTDQRTVERAIQRIQREALERAATTAELQRGIRQHGEQLVRSLDPLSEAVRSTMSGKLKPLPMYAVDLNVVTIGSNTAEKKGDTWSVQTKGADGIELRLLREHLPNDKLWQRLEKFSKSIADWIAARIEFAYLIKRELTEGSNSSDVSGTAIVETFDRAGLAVIDSVASAARIDGRHGIDELLDSLVFDSMSGDLGIGSTRLLSIEKGDIEKYRTVISKGVKVVMQSGIGRGVLTARIAFVQATSDLLDELTILGLVTYLPGTCSSCKRFRL